ncbi:MAG: DUF4440 domain-containing protein [Candidatus Eisenbacteria bacterium]|uniref:DUF4440 domain-containing protein n=1 Tax=Eiseniibacteriota bacterium TaxID=2212470 RepID=A0A538S788_UNCEI|nr:MAG: DUF4440 domain-containing protein [Candidatus Eisenbacteria bacterium]
MDVVMDRAATGVPTRPPPREDLRPRRLRNTAGALERVTDWIAGAGEGFEETRPMTLRRGNGIRASMRSLGAGLLLLGATVATIGASGCAKKDHQAEVAELKSALEARDTQFTEAFSRRDVAAIGAMYTADAEALPPGLAPVRGRLAIQDMWKGLLSMPVGRMLFTTLEVDGNGATAWESGRYTLMATNGSTMDQGKYIVIWKHGPDGWQLYRDMWSSDTPQQGVPSPKAAQP